MIFKHTHLNSDSLNILSHGWLEIMGDNGLLVYVWVLMLLLCVVAAVYS